MTSPTSAPTAVNTPAPPPVIPPAAVGAPIRIESWLLIAAGNAACETCGGHLPDHDWADLNEDGTVADCSEQAR